MRQRQQGISITEVLVALAILGIVLAVIVPTFTGNLAINTRSEASTQAAAAAQHVLEKLRLYDPAAGNYPPEGVENVTISGRTYQVSTTYCATAAYCTAASKHIQAEVRFNGETLFTAETVYTQLALQSR